MADAQPPKELTHGEIVRWRRVKAGPLLAEVRYNPGQRVPRHAHPRTRLLLVLRGALDETVGGITETHRASTLLFRSPGEPHEQVASNKGATCLVVELEEPWLERARQLGPVLSASASFRGGLLLHLAHRLYGEFRMRDEVSRLAIDSIALGVLAEASRRFAKAGRPQAPAWLQAARALVEQRFAEPLTLRAVAERVGVHPVHLARSFRRFHQTTLGGYVRELRIEFARGALATPAPLVEIAAAAGFCDQSHFSLSFKRHTGLTPAEYRLFLRSR